jgi:hypothetical protein
MSNLPAGGSHFPGHHMSSDRRGMNRNNRYEDSPLPRRPGRRAGDRPRSRRTGTRYAGIASACRNNRKRGAVDGPDRCPLTGPWQEPIRKWGSSYKASVPRRANIRTHPSVGGGIEPVHASLNRDCISAIKFLNWLPCLPKTIMLSRKDYCHVIGPSVTLRV